MNDTNTGGAAFPTARVNINGVDEQDGIQAFGAGMTLRDYFAAHATEEDICTAMSLVQKVEVVRDLGNGHKVIEQGYPENTRQIARYIHADTMLKARQA